MSECAVSSTACLEGLTALRRRLADNPQQLVKLLEEQAQSKVLLYSSPMCSNHTGLRVRVRTALITLACELASRRHAEFVNT